MSLFQCIFACLLLLVSEAGAQISGTFKISQVGQNTFGAEQVSFNADKTADVIYGSPLRPSQGKLEKVTRESRGTYFTYTIEEKIASCQKETPLTDETSKLIKQISEFKGQGYDLYVIVKFKAMDGSNSYLAFVRKGNELIDIMSGSIFRKPFFSF